MIQLSACLDQIWTAYTHDFKKSRERISEKRVHRLRTASRRLEAAMELLAGLESNAVSGPARPLLKSVRKLRKKLGPLRDAHVELQFLDKRRDPDLHALRKFIRRRESKARRRAKKRIRRTSLEAQAKLIRKIEKSLRSREGKKQAPGVLPQLQKQIHATRLQFQAAQRACSPGRPMTIHKVRIAAKKLRYQNEIMRSLSRAATAHAQDVEKLQSVIGELQNDNVFLRRIRRYLKGHRHSHDKAVFALRNRISEDKRRQTDKTLKALKDVDWMH